ncbi:HepT-like ribonuclease domain-containing protein [Paramagnetospirillum caucaseum]|uniref:HepT-like ribonuclease domain-containing protein n=1 Tax=Paramagnetospirillum caucaseum TaxID=1244869 RepID=UPI000346B68B|nr:DUF86 domain-containing protein [Paramagnetospirillum caucaseum]
MDDIIGALNRIEDFIGRTSKPAFLADEILISAVTYQLFIVGEAARHLAPGLEERHPSIPWREMRGMRNIIAHEYGAVDSGAVWDVTTNDLAPLRLAMMAERDFLTSC